MQSLSQALETLTSLKELKLELNQYVIFSSNSYERCLRITDSGLQMVIKEIGKVSSLKAITLDFNE